MTKPNEKKLKELLRSITIDHQDSAVLIGKRRFVVAGTAPIAGTKKLIFRLAEPHTDGRRLLLKIVRSDARSLITAFESLRFAVERHAVLGEHNVPHTHIIAHDTETPWHRYLIQEDTPDDALSAAELITEGALSEEDVRQMASHINTFEADKKWQIDTNPFNWFRVVQNRISRMTYVDGKVYAHDSAWEFRRVGLLQWTDPRFIAERKDNSAAIPSARDREDFLRVWREPSRITNAALRRAIEWWKKYLDPGIAP